MYKVTYQIRFHSGRVILLIFVNGTLADELTLPYLPTFVLAANNSAKALWTSWINSIKEE